MPKHPQFLIYDKPLAYLDHGILNLLIRNKESDLFKELMDYQTMYSYITLEEIRKGKKFHKCLLDALYKLNALYFEFIYTGAEKNYSVKDYRLSEKDPYIIFSNYKIKPNPIDYNSGHDLKDAFLSYAFISHGGNINDLNIKHPIKDLKQSPDLKFLENEDKENLNISLKLIEKRETPMTVKDIRDAYNTGPNKLNNISPKYAVKKIEAILLELGNNEFSDIFSQHDFTSCDINGKIEKVDDIYSCLDIMGYYSDNYMDQLHDFNSSRHDAKHVSVAMFSNRLYTTDKKLAMKAKASYYHLGVPVEVKLIGPKGDRLIE